MNKWVWVSVVGGAILSAAAVLTLLWKVLCKALEFVIKVVKAIIVVAELHPVVMHIAKDFKSNGESTLKASLIALTEAARSAQESADKAVKIADEARAAVNLQTALLEKMLKPED